MGFGTHSAIPVLYGNVWLLQNPLHFPHSSPVSENHWSLCCLHNLSFPEDFVTRIVEYVTISYWLFSLRNVHTSQVLLCLWIYFFFLYCGITNGDLTKSPVEAARSLELKAIRNADSIQICVQDFSVVINFELILLNKWDQ